MKTIQISDKSRIIVERKMFKEKEYLDTRKQYLDEQGEWKPTNKGIMVLSSLVQEVIQAQIDVAKEAKIK